MNFIRFNLLGGVLFNVIDEELLQNFGRSSKDRHQRDWEGMDSTNSNESKLDGDSVPERLDSDDEVSFFITISMDRVNHSWYLDLDSSYLICLSWDFFNAYMSHSGGSVLMG